MEIKENDKNYVARLDLPTEKKDIETLRHDREKAKHWLKYAKSKFDSLLFENEWKEGSDFQKTEITLVSNVLWRYSNAFNFFFFNAIMGKNDKLFKHWDDDIDKYVEYGQAIQRLKIIFEKASDIVKSGGDSVLLPLCFSKEDDSSGCYTELLENLSLEQRNEQYNFLCPKIRSSDENS